MFSNGCENPSKQCNQLIQSAPASSSLIAECLQRVTHIWVPTSSAHRMIVDMKMTLQWQLSATTSELPSFHSSTDGGVDHYVYRWSSSSRVTCKPHQPKKLSIQLEPVVMNEMNNGKLGSIAMFGSCTDTSRTRSRRMRRHMQQSKGGRRQKRNKEEEYQHWVKKEVDWNNTETHSN